MAILGFGSSVSDIVSKLLAINNMNEEIFCELFISNLYDRILRNLFDKTIFKNEMETSKALETFFDNPLIDAQNKGLITLIKNALVCNGDLGLKYDKVSNTIQIIKTKKEYEANGGENAVYFSFKYLLNLNTTLLYYAKSLFLLTKSLNVKILNSSSLIIYLKGLSESVAKNQVANVNKQVENLINSINGGNPGILDAESKIESGIVEVSGISDTSKYIMEQISLCLRYSVNFFVGESTVGLGSTGEQDQEKDFKATSISFNEFWKPIINKLYNTEIELKIDKWQLSDTHRSYMDWVETNSLLPREIKQQIISTILESNGLIDKKQAKIIDDYKEENKSIIPTIDNNNLNNNDDPTNNI